MTERLSISQLLNHGFESFKKNSKSVVPLFVGLHVLVFLLTQIFLAPKLNYLMIPVMIFMWIAIFKSYKTPFHKFDVREILDLKDPNLKTKTISLLWVFIIWIVLVFILLMLLIIPGVYFLVYWFLFPFIVLDQKISGLAALKKSKEMLKGHWWKTFALVSIFLIINIAASSIINIFLYNSLLSGLLITGVTGVLFVFFGYVAVAYYFSLKK